MFYLLVAEEKIVDLDCSSVLGFPFLNSTIGLDLFLKFLAIRDRDLGLCLVFLFHDLDLSLDQDPI